MKKMIVPITLMALVFCLFISSMVIPPSFRLYAMSIALFVFFSAVVLYNTRNAGPYARKIGLSMAACFALGFGLYLGTQNIVYFVLGIFSIPLIILWINYLRYPPQLWKVVWLYRRKKQAEASQSLNELIKTHPQDWKAFIMRSDLHLNRGQIAEAERDSRMAIKLKPDYHEGYNQLGRSLMVMAQYTDARQAFEAAHQRKPNSGYLANIGAICYRLGDYRAAVEALTKAARTGLDHPFYSLSMYYFLGRSLENIGEQKKAHDAFKKMKVYGKDIKLYIEQINVAPDYAETVTTRADLAEIQRLLNT